MLEINIIQYSGICGGWTTVQPPPFRIEPLNNKRQHKNVSPSMFLAVFAPMFLIVFSHPPVKKLRLPVEKFSKTPLKQYIAINTE